MGLDWTEPFKIAFELFMFGLGWLLVVVIVTFFLFLTYAVIYAFIKTVRDRKKGVAPKRGIISFDKK
jgi:hypothetical protein